MAPSGKEKKQFIGLLLLGWSCFAAAYGYFFLEPWLARLDWVTTRGHVRQVALTDPPFGHGECQNERRDPNNHTTMVRVVYQYEVEGRSFVSDQFTHEHRGDVNCTVADARAAKAEYERAETVEVFYDPVDPKRSLLRMPDELSVYLGGAALGVSLLVLLVSFVRARDPR